MIETASSSIPSKLWVKYDAVPTRVKTAGCEIVDDFIKAIKAELTPKLDHVAVTDISIHLSENSNSVDSEIIMRDFAKLSPNNSKKNPIIVKVSNGKLFQ